MSINRKLIMGRAALDIIENEVMQCTPNSLLLVHMLMKDRTEDDQLIYKDSEGAIFLVDKNVVYNLSMRVVKVRIPRGIPKVTTTVSVQSPEFNRLSPSVRNIIRSVVIPSDFTELEAMECVAIVARVMLHHTKLMESRGGVRITYKLKIDTDVVDATSGEQLGVEVPASAICSHYPDFVAVAADDYRDVTHKPQPLREYVLDTMSSIRDVFCFPTARRQCCVCLREPGEILRCGRCRLTRYCSVECQRHDYRQHRRSCVARDNTAS